MTGYDIKRRFRDPIGSSTGRATGRFIRLKKLEHEAWLRCEPNGTAGARAKSTRLLAKGREHFLRTLREPAQPIFVYDEAQVKIYFAHHDPEAALHHIERERRFSPARGSRSSSGCWRT